MQDEPLPACPSCRGETTHETRVPLGLGHPEINIYRCKTCKQQCFFSEEDGVQKPWP